MRRHSKCRNSDGRPKAAHQTRENAWKAVRGLEDQNLAIPGTLKPYQCPECGLFHIGRPRGQREHREKNPRRRTYGAWS